mmetsp:Transcript_54912/g.129500  ORF Transcript_54912/g.129500 Transcript_54912/m.129500 type:complete len:221 (-) Transcript_54912:867-1529(-)
MRLNCPSAPSRRPSCSPTRPLLAPRSTCSCVSVPRHPPILPVLFSVFRFACSVAGWTRLSALTLHTRHDCPARRTTSGSPSSTRWPRNQQRTLQARCDASHTRCRSPFRCERAIISEPRAEEGLIATSWQLDQRPICDVGSGGGLQIQEGDSSSEWHPNLIHDENRSDSGEPEARAGRPGLNLKTVGGLRSEDLGLQDEGEALQVLQGIEQLMPAWDASK